MRGGRRPPGGPGGGGAYRVTLNLGEGHSDSASCSHTTVLHATHSGNITKD
jgi:hypothetical protein